MVARLQQTAGKLPEENMLKEAQVLFSVAFHEMTRQVSVHCLERGHLMGKIWWSEVSRATACHQPPPCEAASECM